MPERVLIVDDEPSNAVLFTHLLRKAGMDVRSAANGDEMHAAIAGAVPDVVLMDIQLPGKDGLELARELKADPVTARAVVVAVSSYAMAADRERALAAGCDGYISKPIQTRSFVAEIREFVQRVRGAEARGCTEVS